MSSHVTRDSACVILEATFRTLYLPSLRWVPHTTLSRGVDVFERQNGRSNLFFSHKRSRGQRSRCIARVVRLALRRKKKTHCQQSVSLSATLKQAHRTYIYLLNYLGARIIYITHFDFRLSTFDSPNATI